MVNAGFLETGPKQTRDDEHWSLRSRSPIRNILFAPFSVQVRRRTAPDNDYGGDVTRCPPERLDDGYWGQNGHDDSPDNGDQSMGRYALRHPLLVGVVAVIGLLVLATAVGYTHQATYTAIPMDSGRSPAWLRTESPASPWQNRSWRAITPG